MSSIYRSIYSIILVSITMDNLRVNATPALLRISHDPRRTINIVHHNSLLILITITSSLPNKPKKVSRDPRPSKVSSLSRARYSFLFIRNRNLKHRFRKNSLPSFPCPLLYIPLSLAITRSRIFIRLKQKVEKYSTCIMYIYIYNSKLIFIA